MPEVLEYKGAEKRRFRWLKLRYEYGHYTTIVSAEYGLLFTVWKWDGPLPSSLQI